MTKKLFAAYAAGTALIALAVIHRTVEPGKSGNKLAGIAPIAPKILEITPGTLFTPKDETEYNEIMFAKAARFPDERDNLNKIDRLDEFFPEEEENGDLEAERQRARDKINAAAAARKAKAKADEDADNARLADEAEAQRVAEEEAAAQKKADEEAAAAAQKKAADGAAAEAQRVADEEAALKVAADKKAAAAAAQKNGNKKPAKADEDDDKNVV